MPRSRALRRPSDSGSMPATPTSSSDGLRAIFIIRSVPMLPLPMMATRSLVTRLPRACASARRVGSRTRPKRSSRNGSSSAGRLPVAIISASARPDGRCQRDSLHRVAGRDEGVVEGAGAIEDRQAVGGDRPHAGPLVLDLGRLPRHERLPRAGHDRVDPPPVEAVVDAAELHRAADAHAVTVRRHAHVHVREQDRVRRHDRGPDREAVALAGLHRDGDADGVRERRRPRARSEHDGVRLEVAGGGAHVRQPVPLAHQLEDLGALLDVHAVAAQRGGQAGGDRVGLARASAGARGSPRSPPAESAGSSSCSSEPVITSSGRS